jgi:hypothetical protein
MMRKNISRSAHDRTGYTISTCTWLGGDFFIAGGAPMTAQNSPLELIQYGREIEREVKHPFDSVTVGIVIGILIMYIWDFVRWYI